MIYIKTLKVKSSNVHSAVLEWEYIDSSSGTDGIELEIYRSETPEPVTAYSGIAYNISPNTQSYIDTTLSGINSYQFHTWYYRIKVVDINDPEIYSWSIPAHLSVDLDAQAKIMLHHKSVGIKKYGRKIKILKKRVAQGERCSCWDNILQRSTEDNCPLCHGTGIKTTGGYYDPIEVRAAFNTRPKQNDITPFGVWQKNDVLMDILNYPVISPDDLVIDPNNNRYKVKQVSPYHKDQALISQRCIMSLQEKSNEVYDIEV